jgi:hypothetical protein
MNSNLYIFAVGGTGSRVVKALTMLLASGVEMKNTDTVVPIIVDPHRGNKDLQRTEDLLKNYQRLRKSLKVEPTKGEFFATKINTLKEMVATSDLISDAYVFELKGINNEKFKDYIGYNTLDDSNKALASLLFSDKNLETKMDIGFVGNPNIGSVVLNQFKESSEFKFFASNFKSHDRIFIISSIFGGTGAAGFPIILKNLRGATSDVPNHHFLKKAMIGAITVLPYFGVEPNEDKVIDKATFVSKTKSALYYYNKGVNPDVNKLYYIGDEVNKDYGYDPGAGGQQNDAHFIEMASAMAIVDFMNTPSELMVSTEGVMQESIFSEFGIKNDAETISLSDLDEDTIKTVAKPLTKMVFLCRYMEEQLKKSVETARWTKTEPKIDRSFLSGSFNGTYFKEFRRNFSQWLSEMARNKRSFKPFLLDNDTKLSDTIFNVKPKESFFSGKLDFDAYDEYLSKIDDKQKSFVSAEDKLLSIFSKATDKMLSERYESLFKHL